MITFDRNAHQEHRQVLKTFHEAKDVLRVRLIHQVIDTEYSLLQEVGNEDIGGLEVEREVKCLKDHLLTKLNTLLCKTLSKEV